MFRTSSLPPADSAGSHGVHVGGTGVQILALLPLLLDLRVHRLELHHWHPVVQLHGFGLGDAVLVHVPLGALPLM